MFFKPEAIQVRIVDIYITVYTGQLSQDVVRTTRRITFDKNYLRGFHKTREQHFERQVIFSMKIETKPNYIRVWHSKLRASW